MKKIYLPATLIWIGFSAHASANIGIDPRLIAYVEPVATAEVATRMECHLARKIRHGSYVPHDKISGPCTERLKELLGSKFRLTEHKIYSQDASVRIEMNDGNVIVLGPVLQERRVSRRSESEYSDIQVTVAQQIAYVMIHSGKNYYNQYGFYYREFISISDEKVVDFNVVRIAINPAEVDPTTLEFRKD